MVKKELGICIGYFGSMEMRGSHTIMNNYNNILVKVFPGGSDGKASVYNVRDLGSISGLGRFSGEGNFFLTLERSTSSVHFSHSVLSEFCDPVDYSMTGFPVRYQLPELAQTPVI